ncbi:MAG: hypothetical protein JW719_08385 [Pirellulales bacterium]|nr:hypothetical protein [Pirellulales bacterium]
MALKRREKILAATAAALVAIVVLQVVYSSFAGPGEDLQRRRDELATGIERKENMLANGRRAAAKLETRRRASLPPDPEVAQSLYEMWLRQLATDARLSDTKLTFLSRQPVGDVFHVLRFNLHAKATLGELTDFLYRFYRAGYLHQIVSLTITPKDQGAALDVTMMVQALSLTDAPAADKLVAVDSDRPLDTLAAYRRKIAGRDLFAPYVPPRPVVSRPVVPRPVVETVDPLAFTELNAIIAVGGRPQVWINAKMTGDHYELFEGEEARIAGVRCKILRIDQREAEIEVDGKPFLVPYGKSLRDGKPR